MENDTQLNVSVLDKKAVKAALDQKWKAAIEANMSLLAINPKDKKANIRLGRAYLQTRKYKEAERIFRKVLRLDPISAIAKKNLALAKSKKKIVPKKLNNNYLIKEPGTTASELVELTVKNLTAEDFEPREELGLKVNKASANVVRKGKVIGKIITPDLVKRLNHAKKKRANLMITFHSEKNNTIRVNISSDIAIFKAERQELKPYMKKGTIDEPAIEMGTTEKTK